MTLTKQQKQLLTFGSLALLAGILLVVFWNNLFGKKETCPNGAPIPPDGDCVKVMTADQVTAYVGPTGANSPAGSNTGGCTQPIAYIPEQFPIKKGMQGENVKKIQRKIGAKADGFFGCVTESLLWKKYEKPSVSQTMFNTEFA